MSSFPVAEDCTKTRPSWSVGRSKDRRPQMGLQKYRLKDVRGVPVDATHAQN